MNESIRGNAAPETALAVSFTLLVLFGIVQLTTTDFYQVAADGAAFVGAHDTAASDVAPSSAQASDAQAAAKAAFSHILAASITAVKPNQSTFETDVSQQIPGISALGNPTALTVTSRVIEESNGASNITPAADCTSAVTSITNSGTSGATAIIPTGSVIPGGTSIGLIGASSIISGGSGTAGLSLNNGPLSTKIGTGYSGLPVDLTSIQSALSSLSTLLSTLPLGLGTTIEQKIGPVLEQDVAGALSGTFNSVTALSGITSALNSLSLLPAVTAPITSLLSGGVAGTGLLGPNGPLAALAAAEKVVDGADTAATTVANAACAVAAAKAAGV